MANALLNAGAGAPPRASGDHGTGPMPMDGVLDMARKRRTKPESETTLVPILVLVKLDDVVGPAVLDIAGWLHYVPACVVG